MFFLSLLKQKLPQGCPKRVGGRGVKATFGQCPKVSSFFSRMSSLMLLYLWKTVAIPHEIVIALISTTGYGLKKIPFLLQLILYCCIFWSVFFSHSLSWGVWRQGECLVLAALCFSALQWAMCRPSKCHMQRWCKIFRTGINFSL